MLLWREKIPADWLPNVLGHLPAVLVDHAHLERKAATTALTREETTKRLDAYLDLDAELIRQPNPLPMLH
jgi:tRNA-(ms[2]io[6]A)-hydroxylase